MRTLRRLAIVLVILGGLFVAANVYAERVAEDRLGDAVAVAFGLSEPPDVDLSVFPIATRIFTGMLPEVTFTAEDVTIEDLRLSSLEVRLRDVEVIGGLLGSGKLAVQVAEGNVMAIVSEDAVNELLAARGERATVRLLADGRVRARAVRTFLGARRTIVSVGGLALRKRTLVYTAGEVTVDGEEPPPGVEGEARRRSKIEARIPELPGGFRARELTVTEGRITLAATLSEQRVDLVR
jgi:hypothetical protein